MNILQYSVVLKSSLVITSVPCMMSIAQHVLLRGWQIFIDLGSPIGE